MSIMISEYLNCSERFCFKAKLAAMRCLQSARYRIQQNEDKKVQNKIVSE